MMALMAAAPKRKPASKSPKDHHPETLDDPEVLTDFVSRIGEGIYITNEAGEILDANPAMLEMLGVRSMAALRALEVTDLLDPAQRAQEVEILRRDGEIHDFEIALKRADGSIRYVLDTAYAVKRNKSVVYRGIMRDITDRKRLEAQLLEQSVRDPLTGAFNRRHLESFEAKWQEKGWGCIVFDIDHFKHYNDTRGHHAGDEALVGLSRFLLRQLRSDASLVRLGGDEFAILLAHVDARQTAGAHERIENAARTQSPVPISMGSAAREGQEPLEQTLRRADANLYQVRTVARAPNEERRKPK